VYMFAQQEKRPVMPGPETNARKIAQRLGREGWLLKEGGAHALYSHPEKPGVRIVLPRHREVSPNVARSIAKLAGWN
jgi:predicted RNA binding protein YcfA (HicA-like mRNA interferase family)